MNPTYPPTRYTTHRPNLTATARKPPALHSPHPTSTPTSTTNSTTPAPIIAPAVTASIGRHHDANLKHRNAMEDEFILHQCERFPAIFAAIYDGHGGRTAASLLKQLLHRLFLDELLGDDTDETDDEQTSTHHTRPMHTTQLPRSHCTVALPDDDVISTCSTPPYDSSGSGDDADMSSTLPLISHAANTPGLDVASAFTRAYNKMDAVLKFRNCIRVGATAVTAFVRQVPGVGRMLSVANCGDSRAVLSRGGHSLRLTIDHRPDDGERQRVEANGGFILFGRVNGVLNVTRAFGDHCMKSVVVSTPAIHEMVLTPADEFLVLACDGLWDFVDDDTVVQLAQRGFDKGLCAQGVAQMLVKEAIDRKSTDNVSVMVIQFDMEEC